MGKENETYKYCNLLLDFVHRVTDAQTLKHQVSVAGSASIFRQKAPNLLDPSDEAILYYWVPLKRSKVYLSSWEQNQVPQNSLI